MPKIKTGIHSISSQERTLDQSEVMLYTKMEWEKETKLWANA